MFRDQHAVPILDSHLQFLIFCVPLYLGEELSN